MKTLLSIIVKELLSLGWGVLTSWFKKSKKKKKSQKEIDSQRDKVKKAVDVAYDGTPVTKKEMEDIADAWRILGRDY